MTELHDLASLGVNLEPGRASSRGAVRNDLGEALDFSPVLRTVRTISPAHYNETLTVHAEAIVGVKIDPAENAILCNGSLTTADRRQPAERPANPHQTVATLTVVFE